MAIVQVSVIPIGTGNPSVSSHVAQAVSVLERQKDVKYQIAPMGTVMEGNLDRLLAIVKEMHNSVLTGDVQRVLTVIVIDDRRDKVATLESKVNAVKARLKKPGAAPV